MNLKKFNQEWIQKFEDSYEKNLPFLIESFVMAYSEKYRNLIESKLKNINFIYIMCEYAINCIQNYDFKDKRIIKLYEKHFKHQNTRLNICKDYNHYVKENMVTPIKIRSIYNTCKNFLLYDETNAAMLMYPSKNSFEYYVVLSILAIDDATLIHELNHIMMEEIWFFDKRSIETIEIFKNVEATELFNEIISKEVCNNFKSMGGNICALCYPKEFQIECFYSSRLWIIDPFYKKFKNLVKESCISKNGNLIYNKLGKKNFTAFLDLVKCLYNKKVITNQDIKKRDLLIKLMEEHLKREKDFDYEKFYQELESMGHKVRVLKR